VNKKEVADMKRRFEGELLLCPFCRSKDVFLMERFSTHHIECETCFSSGPLRKTKQNAIIAWNKAKR